MGKCPTSSPLGRRGVRTLSREDEWTDNREAVWLAVAFVTEDYEEGCTQTQRNTLGGVDIEWNWKGVSRLEVARWRVSA